MRRVTDYVNGIIGVSTRSGVWRIVSVVSLNTLPSEEFDGLFQWYHWCMYQIRSVTYYFNGIIDVCAGSGVWRVISIVSLTSVPGQELDGLLPSVLPCLPISFIVCDLQLFCLIFLHIFVRLFLDLRTSICPLYQFFFLKKEIKFNWKTKFWEEKRDG